jgi:hypothetical protein
MRKLFLILLMAVMFQAGMFPAFAAQTKPVSDDDKPLTVGEAVNLVSATDFMKKKIGEFLNWTVGYDLSAVNQIKLVPTIKNISITPRRSPPDGRTLMELQAVVDDPGGLSNIRGVRADLSSIGRFSNMTLVDNGLWGDKISNDGVFTLQSNIDTNVQLGPKEIPVAVANKKGWMAVGKISIDVQKDPVIIYETVQPNYAKANGVDRINFEIKIDNPGRLEDITGAYLDLRPLNGNEKTPLELAKILPDGAVYSLQVVVPQGVTSGRKNIILSVNNLAGGSASANLEISIR